MSSIHNRLRDKISEIAAMLHGGNIAVSVLEQSLREYSLQAAVTSGGNTIGSFTLYFSPKRRVFTLKPQRGLPAELAAKLEALADGRGESAPTATNHKTPENTGISIYVDGSYIDGRVGYGLVILRAGEVVFEYYGRVDNREYVSARQVAGELVAVGKAIQWCRNNAVVTADVYYDYAGIEAWATGRWKTNQELTVNYAAFVRTCGVALRWHKVKSHTGDRWNDYADELAKRGAKSG